MSTKTSKQTSSDYVGDPVLEKESDDNSSTVYTSKFLWVEKGGGAPACNVATNRLTAFFLEDPNSVKTTFLRLNTNLRVFDSSNYPDLGCVLSGNQLPISVGIWYNPDITDEEIDRQTEIMGGPWTSNGSLLFPNNITQFVIQPTHENYSGKVWVIFKFEGTGFNNSFSSSFSDYQYEVRR